MRYVEIDARNYYWRKSDDTVLEKLKKRANNDFVKKWIDTTFKKFVINDMEALLYNERVLNDNDPDYVKNAIKNNQEIYVQARYVDYDLYHWIDYLNTLPPRPIKMSVHQVIDAVLTWDTQKINVNGIGKIEPVLKLGSLTWYKLLDKDALKYESQYMKHCVGKDEMTYGWEVEHDETNIYSLRDSNNKPHVTIEICDNELIQVKGNSNKPFKEIYRKPVLDFLNSSICENVVLDTSDAEKDLIDNDLCIFDGVAYTLDNMPDDIKEYPAIVFEKLYNRGVNFNKKVVIAKYDTLGDIILHSDLDIECDTVTFKGKGNVNVKANNVYLKEFEGKITGNSFSVSCSESKVDFDLKCDKFESYKSKIELKRHNTFTGFRVRGKSIIKGDVTILGISLIHLNDSILDNVILMNPTLDIIGIRNCNIKNLEFKRTRGKVGSYAIANSKIGNIMGDLDVFTLKETKATLSDLNGESLHIASCSPKIKHVTFKKVSLYDTKLTEKDFPNAKVTKRHD